MNTKKKPTWEVQQSQEGIVAEAEYVADENQKDCDGEVDYELQEARQKEQDEDTRQEFYESWNADDTALPCVQACDYLTHGQEDN